MDDPRRCQSKRNHRQWAIAGTKYCRLCGGNTPHTIKALGVRNPNSAVPIKHLPVFYSKRLLCTLAEVVTEQLETNPSEQTQLFEELAIARVMCGDVLKLWDAVRSLPEETPDQRSTKLLILSNAEACAKGALNDVRVMCEAAARVRAMSSDKVSVHNLQFLVNQITRISYDVFGENNMELAKLFEQKIREEVRLVDEQQLGTAIVPGGDEQALAMDATIP